jgi:putative copper export protein
LEQAYGRWLLVKIVLFGAGVTDGAFKLLRLKRRLLILDETTESLENVFNQLEINVQLGLSLRAGVIVIGAILGRLPSSAPTL